MQHHWLLLLVPSSKSSKTKKDGRLMITSSLTSVKTKKRRAVAEKVSIASTVLTTMYPQPVMVSRLLTTQAVLSPNEQTDAHPQINIPAKTTLGDFSKDNLKNL
jgi:hypothetical protein